MSILESVYNSALELHNTGLMSDEILGEFKLLCGKDMSNICEKIEDLKGTCNSINLDDFTVVELQLLDEEIFLCDQCGWWCPIEEITEDNICQDCKDET